MSHRIVFRAVFLLAMVVACARNGNGYHDVKPPPPPPPPPVPIELLVSVENSTLTAGAFDAIEAMITGWRNQLAAAQVPYLITFFRSSENPDGNYDTGPQGPTPLIQYSDADVAGEVHAALRAIHAMPVGRAPLPLEILSQVIADPRSEVSAGMRQVLISFCGQSAENWQGNGLRAGARAFYRSFFDATFGQNGWRALSVQVPGGNAVDTLFATLNMGYDSPEAYGQRMVDWSDFPDMFH